MDRMSESNLNDGKLELEERIKALESQIAFFTSSDTSNARNKKSMTMIVKSFFNSVFSRDNLELLLSMLALTISVATAYIVLYYK
jgi:hypothetical protein